MARRSDLSTAEESRFGRRMNIANFNNLICHECEEIFLLASTDRRWCETDTCPLKRVRFGVAESTFVSVLLCWFLTGRVWSNSDCS